MIKSCRFLSLVLLLGLGLTTSVFADELPPEPQVQSPPAPQADPPPAPQEEPPPQQEPPPLPLHGVEGMGGVLTTYSAYLVNPGTRGPGESFGMPSIGAAYIFLGHGRHLLAASITETLFGRLELGYGYNYFDLGDLPSDILQASGPRIDDWVGLHNFNARVALLKEGEFDQSWLPALTFGFHYKYNSQIDDISSDLKPALGPKGLGAIGIKDDDGIDFTVYASKMLTFLPRPLLINLGMRSTEAAHIGLFGFTNDRDYLFEGNAVLFLTDRLAIAFEYRQKPDSYDAIPGLVKKEDDWWTIPVAFVVNEHLTLSGGYAHFGDVLNHKANGVWGLKAKWEF
jgi:hypothetical protein